MTVLESTAFWPLLIICSFLLSVYWVEQIYMDNILFYIETL